MSFGLGISFGRLCKQERRYAEAIAEANKGMYGDIVVDRQWENETWLIQEAHYADRPAETVMMTAPDGTQFVMTNKITSFIRKDWHLDTVPSEHKDSVVVLGGGKK